MSSLLFEKYRPASWEQVIGQDKTVSALATIKTKYGLAGKAYFISGQSGTGKTTIARLIAAEIAEEWSTAEIDAQDLTLDYLRSMEEQFRFTSLGEKNGRAWIINEAHGMRGPIVSRLNTLLERIPAHVAVIFTTTIEGQDKLFDDYDDTSAFLSRCIPLPLSRRGLAEPFAQRLQQIAEMEGLDGQPTDFYIRATKDARNNMRTLLTTLQSGAFTRKD